MAHDLVSLITVLDGILHPTDQEDWILDDNDKPLLKSLLENDISLRVFLKKSVITALDQICCCSTGDEDRIHDDHKTLLLKSLLEKATSLKILLEEYVMMQHHLRGNSRYTENVEALQSEIRDAAHEAEDILESHAVNQMLLEPDALRFVSSQLEVILEKFDAAKDRLMKIMKDDRNHEAETMDVIINPPPFVEAEPTSSKPNIAEMVGFEEDALHLKHRLTSSQRSGREIIPIVGMGGIGKTTLARNLYIDPLIVSHFDKHRAWVTVSQDYNVRAILLGLLGCLFDEISNDMLQKNDSELGLTLYQRLCGRRYLVVLDDVWIEKVWDEIKHCFPIENNRSRILITSRELDVAKYPDSACEEHQMHLLNSAQSWNLLRQKVFDAEKEEKCPPLLEEIGHKIARDCGGLPLAISVIGGLLSVDKYSEDLWERIAKDIRSVLSQRDEHFSKILCLSYDNLPLHLKPCFLYMAAFPEDSEVRGSKLVKLWAAEGFLWRSSGSNRSSEDVAGEYLKALVDRNLISVTSSKSNGRAKSYGMHDLLRDLCVRKADVEKFFRVVENEKVPRDLSFNSFRRVSFRFARDVPHLKETLSLSRTLLCNFSYRTSYISPILCTLRLVRVLDLYDIRFKTLPEEILQLDNLRFLAVTCRKSLHSGIWGLRNLQTLIIGFIRHGGKVTLTYEAWRISGLMHLVLKNSTFYINCEIQQVYDKLQTLCGVRLDDLLASNLINGIPNVKKLEIHVDEKYVDHIIDLSHLHKLETLKLSLVSGRGVVVVYFNLPNCLKVLSLLRFMLPVTLVNDVGALPHLEVLKIISCKFQSEEYYIVEEENDIVEEEEDIEEEEEEEDIEEEEEEWEEEDIEEEEEWELHERVDFCSLQFLELKYLDIARWKADSSNFPRLRHLKIKRCDELEELPTSIAEILTLEMMEVDSFNPSLVASAEEIQDAQREYGNESLQIRFH